MGDLGNWPTRLITPSLIDTLEDSFEHGRTIKMAAGLNHIPAGILRRWLDIGKEQFEASEKSETEAADLFRRCEAARARFVSRLQDQLTEAGAGKESSPGSAGWQLERLERDDFGSSNRLEIT